MRSAALCQEGPQSSSASCSPRCDTNVTARPARTRTACHAGASPPGGWARRHARVATRPNVVANVASITPLVMPFLPDEREKQGNRPKRQVQQQQQRRQGDQGDKQPIDERVLKDCATAFSSLLQEHAYWVDEAWIKGTIPADLQGTYFRNGPGMQVDSERCVRHAFDGDGMVFSLAFKEGRAFFRNRFVRTQGFVQEQEAGKPLFRTTFSSGAADGSPLFNPLDLTFKNVANTGVVHWAGKLYALWEAGKPHELDPCTLHTIGETDMGGLLTGPLAGHFRVMRDEPSGQQRWVTFGTDVTFGGLTARFYEHDEHGDLVAQSQHALPGVDITFVHDMAVTDNYYVLVLGPIEFDWARFATQYIFGRCSIAQCLRYNKAGSAQALLFPRPGRPGAAGRRVLKVPLGRAFFPFHNVNAYEQPGTTRVVIDTVGWNDVDFDINRFITRPEYYQGGCRPEYLRVVLDTQGGGRTVSVQPVLQQRTVEFPIISPAVTGRRHKYAYFTADTVGHEHLWGPAQALIQVELPDGLGEEPQQDLCADSVGSSSAFDQASSGVRVQQWLPGPRSYCGESMVVPRPGATHELDAWVIVGVHNAETLRADIAILDAARLSDGPVATLHLPHHLPASLHGSFTPEYLGPDPEDPSVPAWQEPLRMRAL